MKSMKIEIMINTQRRIFLLGKFIFKKKVKLMSIINK